MSNFTTSDLDNNIDNIEDSESDEETAIINKGILRIKNPFFSREKLIVNNNLVKLINLDLKEIYSNYSSIYIICLKNNGNIPESFYNENITADDIDHFVSNLNILEGNLKMLYNPIHKSSCVVVNSTYLSLFDTKFDFNSNELVLPLINLSEDNVKLYKKQYEGFFTIKEYFSSKLINEFYNNSSSMISNSNSRILDLLEESSYWSKNFNTGLNITSKFINRGFNLSLKQRIKDVELKSIIKEVEEIPREGDNYFGFLYKKDKYVDVSMAIKKNGYKLYRIGNSTHLITENDLTYALKQTNCNYEFYKLFCFMLISKDYCHLVLNSYTIITNLVSGNYYSRNYEKINIFKKYILAFKYAIGYSWLTFYTEESIKKSRIVDNDRFVFSINTASNLPYFPLIYDNIHHNPYLPILISRDVIDIKKNCCGLYSTRGDYGIVDLDTFRYNLNIFLCGDKYLDILEGLDWNNLALGGSIIPACITRYNPLQELFSSKDRFFNEYYATSDVDVMCNIQDNFKYIDKVNDFFQVIKKNFNNHYLFRDKMVDKIFSLKSVKSAAIIVNERFIRKNIVVNQSKYTYEFIITHLDDKIIVNLFYEHYLKWKINDNKKYIKAPEWRQNKYNSFFDIVPLNDIVIVLARTKYDWEKYWEKYEENKQAKDVSNENYLEELDKENFNINDSFSDDIDASDENCLISCHENLKYKITSKFMNHDFEIFKTRYEGSFFSTVSQFHLPCVRGFYNGNDVKLLPSCITAAMTLINIDYKYFAGSKDPIEIINKYRMRGYTTILNDSEKIRFVSYSSKVEKWDKLYGGILKNNTASINGIFGPHNVNYSLFKPRHINKELYGDCKPVDNNYKKVSHLVPISLQNECFGTFNYQKTKTAFSVMDDLTIINSNGYVKKLKKWYFDYIYDNF